MSNTRHEESRVGEARPNGGLHPTPGEAPTLQQPSSRFEGWNDEQVATYLRAWYGDPLIQFGFCASERDARCYADVPDAYGVLRIFAFTVEELIRHLGTLWNVEAKRIPSDAMLHVPVERREHLRCTTCHEVAWPLVWFDGIPFCSVVCAARSGRREV